MRSVLQTRRGSQGRLMSRSRKRGGNLQGVRGVGDYAWVNPDVIKKFSH